jgi:hypothetical protein
VHLSYIDLINSTPVFFCCCVLYFIFYYIHCPESVLHARPEMGTGRPLSTSSLCCVLPFFKHFQTYCTFEHHFFALIEKLSSTLSWIITSKMRSSSLVLVLRLLTTVFILPDCLSNLSRRGSDSELTTVCVFSLFIWTSESPVGRTQDFPPFLFSHRLSDTTWSTNQSFGLHWDHELQAL